LAIDCSTPGLPWNDTLSATALQKVTLPTGGADYLIVYNASADVHVVTGVDFTDGAAYPGSFKKWTIPAGTLATVAAHWQGAIGLAAATATATEVVAVPAGK